jgi:hypothetical protein
MRIRVMCSKCSTELSAAHCALWTLEILSAVIQTAQYAQSPQMVRVSVYKSLILPGFKVSKSGTNISFARFGRGIYFAPNSSKANDYNEQSVRSMFVCNVLAGNEYHSSDNMQSLTAPPTGYHSVRGVVGAKLNYPELVVYHDHAVLVTHIILYTVAT